MIAKLEDKIAEHKRKEEMRRTQSEVLKGLVENTAVFMAVVDDRQDCLDEQPYVAVARLHGR